MRLLYRFFNISLFTFLICAALSYKSFAQSYGLSFASHEVFQDKRTGFDLSPGKTFTFKENFDISFDLAFTPNRETYFGYIIRIIEDDKRNIDLVYDAQANNRHFNIIVGERLSKILFDIDPAKLFDQWTSIRIKFDFDNDKIILNCGKASFSEKGFHLKKGSNYKILFGVNNYKQFQTTDVPPMKLRNIHISQNGQVLYNWPLNEESGTVAHEVVNQNDADVVNPVWVTAMHRDWQAAGNITVNGVASIAFNPLSEEVYIVGSDSVYSYSVGKSKWNKNDYLGLKIDLNQGNQSVFNPFDKNLYNFFVDTKFVTKFNFQTQKWDKKFIAKPVTSYWHLNKMFREADTSLYFFGGYGHLLYKNTVQQYELASGAWTDVKTRGDFFTPRYLAGLGASAKGDTAYILGGYGCTSGQQILNPKNMYDMMRFTAKDKTFKKLFNLRVTGEDFAFANSLVIDGKTNTYYALIFPQHKYNSTLQLIKGSLTRPDYELVGNTVPYYYHDTHSFADLYYCPTTKRFIAVTLLRTENNRTTVNIYTLIGPPLKAADIVVVAKNNAAWWYIGAGLLLIVLFGGAAYLFIRRKNSLVPATATPIAEYTTQPVSKPVTVAQTESPATTVTSEITPHKQPASYKNAILLFGDIQVFDAEGVDITKYFTPLIKELFLVILLYSIRWGRGLSSEKLNEILWYDKDVKSARNNRSVNIAKLKLLLERMDHCHLSKDTGYWKIDIDYNNIYVDYQNYLNIVNDKKELDIQKINFLSDITRRGNFLSNIEYEWLDTFKSEISNEVIDTYLHFAHSAVNLSPEYLVELANYIFHFDPVNEEAMVIKCKALSTLGKHSLAKNTFETFIKEYKVIYGEMFKKDFHAVLE